MKYLYILVPFALASMFMSACGGETVTPETKDRIVTLSNDIASLSQTNQALMNDWPIQQAAADTLMLFYHRTSDRYTKNILLKEAGALQADIEKKKSDILANATKLHQSKLELKRLLTHDQLVVLSDSTTRAAITASDTLIKQLTTDSAVTP